MSKSYGTPVEIDARSFADDPRAWLAQRMTETMPWLLAHADDGVIWGKRQDDGTLLLAGDVFPDTDVAVALRAVTLQQARVFGEAGELLIWRTDAGFAARLIQDGPQPPNNVITEQHLLWGPGEGRQQEGFSLLQEGHQGPLHAVPIAVKRDQRARLIVWHYMDYDDEDQAYIALSRLVGLEG